MVVATVVVADGGSSNGGSSSSSNSDYDNFQNCLSDAETDGSATEQQIKDCYDSIYGGSGTSGTSGSSGTSGTVAAVAAVAVKILTIQEVVIQEARKTIMTITKPTISLTYKIEICSIRISDT